MIKINGEEHEAIDHVVTEKNVTTAHDYAMFKLYTNSDKKFHTNTPVDIDGNTDYIIQTDRVTHITADAYEHYISCYENLAFFDKVIPSERIFSRIYTDVADGPRLMSLDEILSHYKRELSYYHNIDIGWDLSTKQKDKQINLSEYAGGLNFTSIIIDLFRHIKSNPKVRRENGSWIFYAQSWYERRNDVTEDLLGYNTSMEQINSQDYATNVMSFASNLSNEEIEEHYFPSRYGWVIPKSDMRIANESSLFYKLDSGNLLITEAIMVAEYVQHGINQQMELDITDHVVTKEEYDVLPSGVKGFEVWGKNARNCVFYVVGDNKIQNLYEADVDNYIFWNFSVHYLKNAMRAKLLEYFGIESPDDDYNGFEFANEFDLRTTKMRFKYVRERNPRLSSHKQYNKGMNVSSIKEDQTASQIEGSRFQRNMAIIANKLANSENEMTFTTKPNSLSIDVLDYAGSSIVTEVKKTANGQYDMLEVKIAEHNPNVKEVQAITRRYTPFPYKEARLTTNMLINDFVEIGKDKKVLNTRLTEFGINNYFKTFKNDFENAEYIGGSVYRRVSYEGYNDEYIHMPVMVIGGYNLSVHAQFEHPRNAGLMFPDGEEDAVPLKYSDDKGIVDDCQWFLTEDISIIDDGTYPKIPEEDNDKFIDGSLTQYMLGFPIDKDPSANLAFTYQINPKVDDEKIVIGEAFNDLNYLIEPREIDYKLYKKNTPYTMHGEDLGTEITDGTITFNEFDRSFHFDSQQTDIKYFALVANGELFIGFNEPMKDGGNTYYINFVGEYTSVNAYFYQFEDSADLTYTIQIGDEPSSVNISDDITPTSSVSSDTIEQVRTSVDDDANLSSSNITAESSGPVVDSVSGTIETSDDIYELHEFGTSVSDDADLSYNVSISVSGPTADASKTIDTSSDAIVEAIEEHDVTLSDSANLTQSTNLGDAPSAADVTEVITTSDSSTVDAPVPKYTLTVNSETGGDATGGGTYEEGETVTISASADSGYGFAGWRSSYSTIDGSFDNPLTFTMPAQNITATAEFMSYQ